MNKPKQSNIDPKDCEKCKPFYGSEAEKRFHSTHHLGLPRVTRDDSKEKRIFSIYEDLKNGGGGFLSNERETEIQRERERERREKERERREREIQIEREIQRERERREIQIEREEMEEIENERRLENERLENERRLEYEIEEMYRLEQQMKKMDIEQMETLIAEEEERERERRLENLIDEQSEKLSKIFDFLSRSELKKHFRDSFLKKMKESNKNILSESAIEDLKLFSKTYEKKINLKMEREEREREEREMEERERKRKELENLIDNYSESLIRKYGEQINPSDKKNLKKHFKDSFLKKIEDKKKNAMISHGIIIRELNEYYSEYQSNIKQKIQERRLRGVVMNEPIPASQSRSRGGSALIENEETPLMKLKKEMMKKYDEMEIWNAIELLQAEFNESLLYLLKILKQKQQNSSTPQERKKFTEKINKFSFWLKDLNAKRELNSAPPIDSFEKLNAFRLELLKVKNIVKKYKEKQSKRVDDIISQAVEEDDLNTAFVEENVFHESTGEDALNTAFVEEATISEMEENGKMMDKDNLILIEEMLTFCENIIDGIRTRYKTEGPSYVDENVDKDEFILFLSQIQSKHISENEYTSKIRLNINNIFKSVNILSNDKKSPKQIIELFKKIRSENFKKIHNFIMPNFKQLNQNKLVTRCQYCNKTEKQLSKTMNKIEIYNKTSPEKSLCMECITEKASEIPKLLTTEEKEKEKEKDGSLKRKSLKRKSLKRKSLKRKSLKRKSLKRKSLKRKSLKR